MVAIMPCAWSYREIGLALEREIASDSIYADWLRFFVGDSYGERGARMKVEFDEMAAAAGAAHRRRLLGSFHTAVRLKHALWDAADRCCQWRDVTARAGAGASAAVPSPGPPMAERLISPEELEARIDDEHVRVVDVRWSLEDRDVGRAAYRAGHIRGAVYLSWLDDLSNPDDSVDGQLAPGPRFADAMQRAGIGDETLVVAYDDNIIFLAARLCWALEVYGHDHARWLDGGLPAWVAAGRSLTREQPPPRSATFTVHPRRGLRRTKEDVLAALDFGEPPLFDCRMDETWRAVGEHIPGARRFAAPALLDAAGRLRSSEEIRRLAAAAGIPRDRPSILYCGGGVSASAAHVALRGAGFDQTSVYDGSWAEWSADPGTPRARHDR